MELYAPIPIDTEWDDDRFAAEVTDRQFRALAERLNPSTVMKEMPGLKRLKRSKPAKACEEKQLTVWLTNAWNTERILGSSGAILEGAGGAALQWSFPQAYYAAYAQVLAFFQVAGFSATKHASVQKQFGQLVLAREYPPTMAFAALGTKKSMTTVGLNPTLASHSSAHYMKGDTGIVDRQIAGFLSSTRRMALDQRKQASDFRTKANKRRKHLTEELWKRVSENQGPTSLLCLLYRKRVKSNYRDIDTFTASGFDPSGVFQSLERIVASLAFVHEGFIAAAMGWDWFASLAERHRAAVGCEPLQRRIPHLKTLLKGAS